MSENQLTEKFIKLLKGKKTKPKDIQNFIQTNVFDINEVDDKGYNPLHYAIKQERADLVYELLNLQSPSEDIEIAKADPNKLTHDLKEQLFTTPLFLALLHLNDDNASSRIIRSLINAGAKLDCKDEEGLSFFLRVCEKGKVDIVSFILGLENSPIEINKELCKGGSALHLAILSDQADIIDLLLEHKIDIGLVDKDNNTALHAALIDNQLNYFKVILDNLVNNKEIENEEKRKILNAVNNDGNTILHELSVVGSSTLINYMLKLPKEIAVDPSIKNKNGFDYKELEKDLLEKKRIEEENIQKEKEERQRLKQEARQEKEEQERQLYEERKRMREKMERQEEFGKKLLEYRGYIFLFVILCVLVMLFAFVKNASKKKQIIL